MTRGALLFAALTGAAAWWVPPLPLFGGGIALGVVLYAAAARSRSEGEERFLRGALIGLNSALNVAGWVLLLGPGVGGALGASVGAVNLLAAHAPLSRSPAFQRVLGYLNLVAPLSWPIVATGALFLAVSAVGSVLLGTFGLRFFRIRGGRWDRSTGTFFLHGGFVANLNHFHTAFNMGNLSFVDAQSFDFFVEHEAGHTLNLAAFGSVFHLVGAVDENFLRRGWRAYAERLAESHVSRTSLPAVHMWRLPFKEKSALQ